jgi:hypothetical protein
MAGRYENLAQRIDDLVLLPLLKVGLPVRFDHKFGAFVDSDRLTPPAGGWGSAWITTIDHLGRGYTLTEMCGSTAKKYIWGDLSDGRGFEHHWNSHVRRDAQKSLISGAIAIPVANRFREIDAFLNAAHRVLPYTVRGSTASSLLRDVETWAFHRSSRSEFI